jgi:hypothetical protein
MKHIQNNAKYFDKLCCPREQQIIPSVFPHIAITLSNTAVLASSQIEEAYPVNTIIKNVQ